VVRRFTGCRGWRTNLQKRRSKVKGWKLGLHNSRASRSLSLALATEWTSTARRDDAFSDLDRRKLLETNRLRSNSPKSCGTGKAQ
jgi:hypothetical protein